jgi:hypothetical protein
MRRLRAPAILGLALAALPPAPSAAQAHRVDALDDVFEP